MARDSRRAGLAVEVSAEGKLKRAMELANKLGARFALIVGDDEMAAGRYALKNMSTRRAAAPDARRNRGIARRDRESKRTCRTDGNVVALDFLGELRRTHTCGELRAADAGKHALLMGWVHRRRDQGGVIFVDLRDRDGITQVVFHEDVGPRRAQPRRDWCGPST